MFDIIIPWKDSGCEYRRKNFEFNLEYYSSISNVIVSDKTEEGTTRSKLRNNAVSKSTADLIFIVDADVFIPKEKILKSIKIASKKKSLVYPFKKFGYMNLVSSEKFMLNNGNYEDISFNSTYEKCSGGAFAVQKRLWDAVGGNDERFFAWGGEMDALSLKFNYAFDKSRYIDGMAYHLYHPSTRIANINNMMLLDEYKSKYYKISKIQKMKKLLNIYPEY